MLLDLSLPAQVDREQLKAFHTDRTAQRLCRNRAATPVAWSLAHARQLALLPSSGYPWGSVPRSAEHGAYANAHDFLRAPAGSRVERFTTIWPAEADRTPWRRLMRALPATCTTVALARQQASVPVGALLESLPSTVRAAAIIHTRRRDEGWLALVDDRFDLVDVDTMHLADDQLRLLADAVARTTRVVLRVNRRAGALLDIERVRLGSSAPAPGVTATAAVLACADGTSLTLDAWPLDFLQERHGRVPIRAQLARTLPEGHGVGSGLLIGGAPAGTLRASHFGGELVRRASAWTLRGPRPYDALEPTSSRDRPRRHETAHNGRALGESEIVPIRDGDRLRFDSVECVFQTRAAT
jgi:hypothetical protein